MTAPSRISLTDERRLRDAVADAVMQTPPGNAERLDAAPDAALTLVESARVAAEEASRLLRGSIDGARAAGHSWGAIGDVLGVSKQAAQQRFGGGAPAPVETGGQRILSPVTALDEMAALELEGRRGWHSVGYGAFHHVLEKSDVQWEHRRAAWGTFSRAALERDGWQSVGHGWFPWSYWARPTDRPAES